MSTLRTLDTTTENNSKLDADFTTIRPSSFGSIGKDVSKFQTSAQCIKSAKLDFIVEKVPVIVNIAGEAITSKKQFATIRTDQTGEGAILGYVGDRYEVVPNKVAFDFTDSIVGEGFASYFKAGSFRNGSRIFICCELPEHLNIEVGKGDNIKPYLLFTTSHDGKGGIFACLTYVRIWCENTLNMALKNAVGNKLSLRHTTNIKEAMKTAQQILGITDLYKEELETIFPKLAQRETKIPEWEAIVASAFATKPEQLKAYLQGEREDKKLAKLIASVDAVKQYDNLNPTQKSLGNTAWGAYNAVTGYFQNVEKTDSFENGDKLASILDGRISKASQTAWDTAVEVTELSSAQFFKKYQLN